MSLITLIRVSLSFSEREIFRDIGFQVEPGDKIGLVGRNGSGKTTLLRIIAGEIPPDSGEVRIARRTRIAYLPQDIHETASGPLLNTVLNAILERADLQEALWSAERSLKTPNDAEEQARLGRKIADIHHEINELDQEFPPHEAEKILLGLGFDTKDFTRPVSTLSGGWKMRAALAALLYQKPDVLLLDEPTNHLDMPSVRWLERFLQGFKGALVLVSHDREFLNRQVNRIVSFEPEGMRSYSGNYDFYLKAREQEIRAIEARARNQEQRIREAERFIERFRSKASKARQAQSKIKLVKKMELVETRRKEKTIRFTFPEAPRSGREAASLEGVSKRFGEHILYENLNLKVMRGQRIAIIGPNGCGKTTLLRLIAGELEPDRGRISLGPKVHPAYFAQHHSDWLNPANTVLEEVYQAVPRATIGFVRSVCGAFLFSGNDVDKPIGVLSGGERARVSLAKLLVKPGNLMLMDEPTNHLDIESSENLIEALKGYGGTLVFVSHNQSFVNSLAEKIWDIREQGIVEYPGRLEEYYDHMRQKDDAADQGKRRAGDATPLNSLPAAKKTGAVPPPARRNRKSEKREQARHRQLIYNTLHPIRKRIQEVEDRIASLESRQKEIEKRLADPDAFADNAVSVPLLAEYRDIRDELDERLLEWEKMQHRLESTKKRLGVSAQ